MCVENTVAREFCNITHNLFTFSSFLLEVWVACALSVADTDIETGISCNILTFSIQAASLHRGRLRMWDILQSVTDCSTSLKHFFFRAFLKKKKKAMKFVRKKSKYCVKVLSHPSCLIIFYFWCFKVVLNKHFSRFSESLLHLGLFNFGCCFTHFQSNSFT